MLSDKFYNLTELSLRGGEGLSEEFLFKFTGGRGGGQKVA